MASVVYREPSRILLDSFSFFLFFLPLFSSIPCPLLLLCPDFLVSLTIFIFHSMFQGRTLSLTLTLLVFFFFLYIDSSCACDTPLVGVFPSLRPLPFCFVGVPSYLIYPSSFTLPTTTPPPLTSAFSATLRCHSCF